MAKKPILTLVEPTTTARSPPATLGKPGATLWRTLTTEFVIDDAAGLVMLAQICAAADRLVGYQEAIERDGLLVRTKQGPKEHPLLKLELSTRAFVQQAGPKVLRSQSDYRSYPPRSQGTRPSQDRKH